MNLRVFFLILKQIVHVLAICLVKVKQSAISPFVNEIYLQFLLIIMQGMTFTCFNYVAGQSGEGGEETPGGAEGGGDGGEKAVPATYAVKLKKADVGSFTETIKEYMPKTPAANGAGGEEGKTE